MRGKLRGTCALTVLLMTGVSLIAATGCGDGGASKQASKVIVDDAAQQAARRATREAARRADEYSPPGTPSSRTTPPAVTPPGAGEEAGVDLASTTSKARLESEALADEEAKEIICAAIDFIKLAEDPSSEEFLAYVGNVPDYRKTQRIFGSVSDLMEGDLTELQSLVCEI